MPLKFPGGLNLKASNSQWATWLELSLLFLESPTISRAELREQLELYFPEEELLDEIVEQAFAEVHARALALGKKYPIGYDSTYVSRIPTSWRDSPVFSFLLGVSTERFYEETELSGGEWLEPAKLFEYVTASALATYLNGNAMRIGSEREPPMPMNFSDCLVLVGKELNETVVGPANPAITTGDEKCDVIAWRPHHDRKPGQLIVLAQCAIGKGSWRKKIGELQEDVWLDQFRWYVKPTRAFAFPFIIDNDDENLAEWRYIAKNGGIPLDRLRLTALADEGDLEPAVVDRIIQWCDDLGSRLPLAA